ncbi:hypothetical protein ACVME8_009192 [Bradyrhizobium diazoefficiens]
MQGEHGHGDVFHHGLGNAGLQHAHQRDVRWKFAGVELVDAGADREDQLEVWKGRRDVIRRHPRHEIAHLGGIADVGPEPERQMRRALREEARPLRAAHHVGLVENRHAAKALRTG